MKFLKIFSVVTLLTLITSCGGSERQKYVKTSIDNIITKYINKQNYSVILADMDYKENNDAYFHKYKIIIPKETLTPKDTTVSKAENNFEVVNTKWIKVSPITFEKYQNDLGMTILSKKNGVLNKKTAPAGYDNYVGNEKYGHWQTNSNGTSFWAFYGQYAFMRSMFGWGSHRYYRNDYSYYNNYRGRSNYYGRNSSFGTRNYNNVNSTWSKKPQSFKQKVQSKVKRSSSALKSRRYSSSRSYGNSRKSRSFGRYSRSSSSRSRSGGFGK